MQFWKISSALLAALAVGFVGCEPAEEVDPVDPVPVVDPVDSTVTTPDPLVTPDPVDPVTPPADDVDAVIIAPAPDPGLPSDPAGAPADEPLVQPEDATAGDDATEGTATTPASPEAVLPAEDAIEETPAP